MLGQSGKESIPPLVTDRRRLIAQQRGLNIVRLPPVLLHVLPHELPPDLGVSRPWPRGAPPRASRCGPGAEEGCAGGGGGGGPRLCRGGGGGRGAGGPRPAPRRTGAVLGGPPG